MNSSKRAYQNDVRQTRRCQENVWGAVKERAFHREDEITEVNKNEVVQSGQFFHPGGREVLPK